MVYKLEEEDEGNMGLLGVHNIWEEEARSGGSGIIVGFASGSI